MLRLTYELTQPRDVAGPDGRTHRSGRHAATGRSTARRRSLIFVISDFIGDVDWEPALGRLGHRHEVVAVRVVDPIEVDLPDLGLVLIEDAETGEQVFADTGDPCFQQRLRAEVEARELAVTSSMRRAGANAYRVGTDEDLIATLIDMVRRSKRRRA